MNAYHIEKYRLPVAVTLVDGDRVAGDVFVQAAARYRSGPEDASDLLNSAEPFFPLVTAGGETELLAKDLVCRVDAELAPDEDPARRAGVTPAVVEVCMSDGTRHNGTVFLEVPLERPRLLDFLNFFAQRFLTLHTTDGARLLNRRFVVRVRPLD
jgi:hypothetical protein